MNKRNLAVIVLVAASLVACGESDEQRYQRVSKKWREEGYQEALVELPKLEAMLFATQEEKENGIERGGDIYVQHCARCHGVYAQGGDTPFDFRNRKTGEITQFKPPELKASGFADGSERERLSMLQGYSNRIKDGGSYMPQIEEFPRDKSGNPPLDAVRKIIDYILNATKLSVYRDYIRQGQPK